MKNSEVLSQQILQDLVLVNKERVEGYKNLGYNADLYDLKLLFNNLADESRKYICDITKIILNRFTSDEAVHNPGKIFKAWINVPFKYRSHSTTAVLHSCEIGEIAILHTYKMAKEFRHHTFITELLDNQEQSLNISYNLIKTYKQVYSRNDTTSQTTT